MKRVWLVIAFVSSICMLYYCKPNVLVEEAVILEPVSEVRHPWSKYGWYIEEKNTDGTMELPLRGKVFTILKTGSFDLESGFMQSKGYGVRYLFECKEIQDSICLFQVSQYQVDRNGQESFQKEFHMKMEGDECSGIIRRTPPIFSQEELKDTTMVPSIVFATRSYDIMKKSEGTDLSNNFFVHPLSNKTIYIMSGVKEYKIDDVFIKNSISTTKDGEFTVRVSATQKDRFIFQSSDPSDSNIHIYRVETQKSFDASQKVEIKFVKLMWKPHEYELWRTDFVDVESALDQVLPSEILATEKLHALTGFWYYNTSVTFMPWLMWKLGRCSCIFISNKGDLTFMHPYQNANLYTLMKGSKTRQGKIRYIYKVSMDMQPSYYRILEISSSYTGFNNTLNGSELRYATLSLAEVALQESFVKYDQLFAVKAF